MNKIMLQDNKKVIVGEIVVDKQKLRSFCDCLISYGFNDTMYEKETFEDLFQSGYTNGLNSGELIFKRFVDYDIVDNEGIVKYTETILKHNYINVISIISCLLGGLNPDDYSDARTKHFIQENIFKQGSFDEIWPICVNNILKENKKLLVRSGKLSSEYIALKCLFDDGIILFKKKNEYPLGQYKFGTGFTRESLTKIVNDSELVLSPSLKEQIKYYKGKKR